VLGHHIALPVLAGPVGLLGLGRRGGEVAVAHVAGAMGTIQAVSGAAFTPIGEIAAAATTPLFLQIYFFGTREASIPAIEEAKRVGCAALILNIDSAARLGARERSYRARRALPTGTRVRDALRFAPQLVAKPAWLADFIRDGRWDMKMPLALREDGDTMTVFESFTEQFRRPPSWDDLAWIRDRWGGPIIVKGVQRVTDAERAVAEGAAGLIVSNHGGNGLDGSVAALRVLPQVVDAVGAEIDVMFDSGVRRGTDVVKALALGARAVLVGRAYMWALMAAGEPGVRAMFELLRRQIDDALAFLGCSSIAELDRSYLDLPRDWALSQPAAS
jgi:isopentenyl diphosphate isomerase/L-lactate dehydrogenase-like FMN-dependent dehydrogenase